MISTPRLATGLVLALAAACARDAPTPRDRLLAQIRGDAVTVVVADSRAISHPRVRAVLDVLATRWPASMGCVLDAAFSAEQVAVAIDAARDLTVVIATANEPRCAALSQRAPGLWLATLGAGPAAPTTTVLEDDRFARARPYLTSAPIAAASLGEVHLIATAQPEPLEAWLAIDSADAVAQAITAQLTRLSEDASTAALAARLRVSRADAQVVIHLDGAAEGQGGSVDVAAGARSLLAWAEQQARPAPARFSCPAPTADIACTADTRYRVRSLRAAAARIVTDGNAAPVVANGAVSGLRIAAAVPSLGLVPGDIVIAIDGRLVASRAMFLHQLDEVRGATTVTVRRGATETELQFAEH